MLKESKLTNYNTHNPSHNGTGTIICETNKETSEKITEDLRGHHSQAKESDSTCWCHWGGDWRGFSWR